MKSQEEQELRAKVEEVRGKLQDLAGDLRAVDDEVEGLAPQRAQHELLDQACSSLERLGELGAASLFWGERIEPARAEERLRDVRDRVSAFQSRLGELDGRRQVILSAIGRQEENLEILGDDLYQIREAEERRKLEWAVERDISPVPRRVQLMAWARGGEEDVRFRKTLGVSMLVSLLFGLLLPLIPLPLPERFTPEDMPRRLVQLVREAKLKPIPPPPVVAEKPPEPTPPEQAKPKPAEEPKPSEQPPESPAVAAAEPPRKGAPGEANPDSPEYAAAAPQPQKQVRKAGILAFRDKFASLSKDQVSPRLGADARLGNADDVSRASNPSRSMLTTNAPGSSGGINLAALSLGVGGGGGGGGAGGGGGGGGLQGVEVGRATSPLAGIGGGGGGRPLARGGPGASRTDEEIQIVFDRYKASFYRLYNRELRKDPTLRGQMVLRLTIEPDGSVSMCMLQSSDMDAPDLAEQVVTRVRTINFGAKDVEALTIVYPIDFLPAA